MAREIKFRGKSIRSKKWLFGGIGDGDNDIIKSGLAIPVDPETVGEFTGFKDIDGNEIFEGDIIQREEKPKQAYKIEMIDGVWCGVVGYDYQSLNWLLLYHSMKVIGNIHDNPELLEGGK